MCLQLAIERARRLRDPNRATTPDAAEALTALQDRDGEPRGMTPEEPTLLAESRSTPSLIFATLKDHLQQCMDEQDLSAGSRIKSKAVSLRC